MTTIVQQHALAGGSWPIIARLPSRGASGPSLAPDYGPRSQLFGPMICPRPSALEQLAKTLVGVHDAAADRRQHRG